METCTQRFERVRAPAYMLARQVAIACILVLTCSAGTVWSANTTVKAPFDVTSYYIPSGWMGDGEQGTKYISLVTDCTTSPHSGRTCAKITYKIGSQGWGGIYYQNPEKNWGSKPGLKITGAKKITFWARGQKGGEVVEFKAGGINSPGSKYHDSFQVTTGEITLTNKWKQYSVSVLGKDLSQVIGGFCWVANRDNNPNGLTFYLDDIRYE